MATSYSHDPQLVEMNAAVHVVARLYHEFDYPPPSSVYHYTTAKGGRGILESGELWATGSKHLNDTSEYAFSKRVLDDVVARVLGNQDDECIILRTALDQVYGEAIFLTCFSEHQDDWTMWHDYGEKGQGFSLEFEAAALPRLLTSVQTFERFGKVQYGEAAFQTRTEPILRDAVRSIRDERWQFHTIRGIAGCLAQCAVLAKDATKWEHEAEWRLVVPGSDFYQQFINVEGRPHIVVPLSNGERSKPRLPIREDHHGCR